MKKPIAENAGVGKDPSLGFYVSEQVATFFLHEAFRFAHDAAAYEVAGELFAERIESITPDPNWPIPEIPTKLQEWLASRNDIEENILDPDSEALLKDAWDSSMRDASSCGRKLSKTKKLQSLTDVVGHVINLATCVEAVINRHLFLLKESGMIVPDHYLMMDRTEVFPKVLFCFKEQLQQKKLHISNLKYLVKLRNHSVHFHTSSADALVPTCHELFGVWREIGSLFGLIQGEPTKNDVDHLIKDFRAKWIE